MPVLSVLVADSALMAVIGCQSTRVRLDNSRIDEAELRKAELACDVAQKLDALEQAEAH